MKVPEWMATLVAIVICLSMVAVFIGIASAPVVLYALTGELKYWFFYPIYFLTLIVYGILTKMLEGSDSLDEDR